MSEIRGQAKPEVRIAPDNKPIEFKLSGELAKKACKIIYPNFSNIDKAEEVRFVENQIIVGGNEVKDGNVTATFDESRMAQVDINILSREGELLEKQTLSYNDFRSIAEIIGKLVVERVLIVADDRDVELVVIKS